MWHPSLKIAVMDTAYGLDRWLYRFWRNEDNSGGVCFVGHWLMIINCQYLAIGQSELEIPPTRKSIIVFTKPWHWRRHQRGGNYQ